MDFNELQEAKTPALGNKIAVQNAKGTRSVTLSTVKSLFGVNRLDTLLKQNPLVPYKRLGAKTIILDSSEVSVGAPSVDEPEEIASVVRLNLTLNIANALGHASENQAVPERFDYVTDLFNYLWPKRDGSICFPVPKKWEVSNANKSAVRLYFADSTGPITDAEGNFMYTTITYSRLEEFVPFGETAGSSGKIKIPDDSVIQIFFYYDHAEDMHSVCTFKEYMRECMADKLPIYQKFIDNLTGSAYFQSLIGDAASVDLQTEIAKDDVVAAMLKALALYMPAHPLNSETSEFIKAVANGLGDNQTFMDKVKAWVKEEVANLSPSA